MTALYLQVLLLFTSVFLLGAALACGLRKLGASDEAELEAAPPVRRVDPLPPAATPSRFEGALSGKPAAAPAAPKPTAPAPAAAPPAPAVARPAPVPPPPVVPAPVAAAPIAATVATAAVAAAERVINRAAAAPASNTAAAPAKDDLKLIEGVDGALELGLNKLGIARFAEIASWRREDVNRINAAFGFRGRVERENWIEQAQVLASGGQTLFSRRLGTAPTVTTPAHGAATPLRPMVEERAAFAAAPPDAIPSATVTPIRPAAGPARDALQRISGISAEIEKTLNAQGVTRYTQISTWTPEDAERIDRLLGTPGRVRRESWIEQAQLLARGGDTGASRAFDRQPAAAAPPTATATTPPAADVLRPAKLSDAIRSNQTPAAPSRADVSILRSVRSEAFQAKPMDAATAAAAAAAAAAGSAKVVRSADMDDLKRIRGIGVLIEKRLNAAGVATYEQVASWTADDIARFSRMLDFKGRIERENWVEQARILAAGGVTEFSHRVDEGKVETSKPRS